jgi:2-polyprenyl-3-methyl-5-hydroxy-6-metoxy-1,4-benzoquinol methylase
MDDPALSESEHLHALHGLRRMNRWTGNTRAAWVAIRELASSLSAQKMSVLDIATGSGDVPIHLCRYAAATGTTLEVDACDLSDRALAFAARSLPEHTSIQLFTLDIVSDPIPRQYDVVMCTTFLHHLSEMNAARVLRKMHDAALKRVIVVDLERGALNWLLVSLGCRLFSRSKVVHFDGPQSVRAAFTINEIRKLANTIGFRRFRVTRSWPCRFVLVGDI